MKTMAMVVVAATVASSVLLRPHPAHAGGSSSQDPCSAPLLVNLALSSGQISATTTLRGEGATMSIVQFLGGLNSMAQRAYQLNAGPRVVPNDRIADFTFVTPGRTHLYAGPVHVFRHGAYQHICRAGVIMVNAQGSTTQQANPYRITFRFNGWSHGSEAWGDAWVGGTHFRLTGTTRTT